MRKKIEPSIRPSGALRLKKPPGTSRKLGLPPTNLDPKKFLGNCNKFNFKSVANKVYQLVIKLHTTNTTKTFLNFAPSNIPRLSRLDSLSWIWFYTFSPPLVSYDKHKQHTNCTSEVLHRDYRLI
jgi:hypothetical protein